MRGLDGSYLARLGLVVKNRVNVIYADAPFAFDANLPMISRYCDELRLATDLALQEEAVLVVAMKVYHAE